LPVQKQLLLLPPLRIVYNANTPPLKFEDENGDGAGLLPDLWRLCNAKKNRAMGKISKYEDLSLAS